MELAREPLARLAVPAVYFFDRPSEGSLLLARAWGEAGALVVFFAIKLSVLLAFGPAIAPDSRDYIGYADQILSGAFRHVDLANDALPLTLYRPIGYPAVIAAAKLIAPDHWAGLVVLFQFAVSLAATAMVYRLARGFGLGFWISLAAAAAGRFLENREVEAEGWEEAPADLRLTEDMFVAHIAGRSMEPKIPDGSLCVFRYGVAGSRQGRLVLVERLGGGTNERYAVKRYRSEKRQTEEGWSHERIVLESLNPEFESWELDPEEERYRVIAEFVCVL